MKHTVKAEIIILLIFAFGMTAVACPDPMKSPWETKGLHIQARYETSFAKLPVIFLVRAYQRFISDISGLSCPMYPSCSRFGLEAVKKHGVFLGFLMMTDRLHRCGHDLFQYRKVLIEGRIKYHDPVP